MPLVNNPSFTNLIALLTANGLNPYVGMGNPNSDILMVGTEMALNAANPIHAAIQEHELTLNVSHWNDLLTNFNHLNDPFNPALIARAFPLNGFNPFSPLLFQAIHDLVFGHTGHTYYGLQRLLNHYEELLGMAQTSVFEDINFINSSFSKCFISEISANPAVNQQQAAFNLNAFFEGERYHFMTTHAATFYQSFATVVIYAGKNQRYVGQIGTENRRRIIRIFNPTLEHNNVHIMADHVYYDNGNGARVILCRHLAAGFGHTVAHNVAMSMI